MKKMVSGPGTFRAYHPYKPRDGMTESRSVEIHHRRTKTEKELAAWLERARERKEKKEARERAREGNPEP